MKIQVFAMSSFLISLLCVTASAQNRSTQVGFLQSDGRLVITVDGEPIATYVYRDGQIPRPYFAHVKAPSGRQVTRNHPPIDGQDQTDHETMHPGIWMAFGDLDGCDFWRNRAHIIHKSFPEPPEGGIGAGKFTEEKQYLRSDNSLVCTETFRCSLYVRDEGYLLTWDSTFHGDHEFYFGDQEEMGLGLRVATSISELKSGKLTDAEGRTGADNIWSMAAAWCDYSGTTDGQHLGMTLMCHPKNFRQSWMHARNYGFVAANPFGREAMKKGPPSRIVIKPADHLRLRYGVWIHGNGEQEPDCGAAFATYLKLSQ